MCFPRQRAPNNIGPPTAHLQVPKPKAKERHHTSSPEIHIPSRATVAQDWVIGPPLSSAPSSPIFHWATPADVSLTGVSSDAGGQGAEQGKAANCSTLQHHRVFFPWEPARKSLLLRVAETQRPGSKKNTVNTHAQGVACGGGDR